MSGHSEFAPIGNRNPPAPMPPVGPVGGNAGQPENVPQVQPQAQPENALVDQHNARSLVQKLDAMLLKAAGMSTKAVDESSIKTVAKMPGVSKAESDVLTTAADAARQTMKAKLQPLADRLENSAAQNLRNELNAELDAKERKQTANLSDQDVVDLVENVIRSSPKDFPLLTKYYLNAE